MAKTFDCIVAGSCVVDLLCKPVRLDEPIGEGVLHPVGPLEVTTGGVTSNAGITLARMGVAVGVFSYVGDDAWQEVIRRIYREEGVDDGPLATHPTEPTSTTVVTIAEHGERSFLHCVGAPRMLDAAAFLDRAELWARTRALLVGYYSLMPGLEPQLPEAFAAVREAGCMTALDAAGTGGSMQPLDVILPHLDVYVPSRAEAEHQTGESDPQAMIAAFRDCCATGRGVGLDHTLLGVKLGGEQGVMLSPRPGGFVHVPSCRPPGDVVDTTGAGDSFYAGLLAGLLRGLCVEDAGKLGCAAAACCVTAFGGSTGARSYDEVARIAGI